MASENHILFSAPRQLPGHWWGSSRLVERVPDEADSVPSSRKERVLSHPYLCLLHIAFLQDLCHDIVILGRAKLVL